MRYSRRVDTELIFARFLESKNEFDDDLEEINIDQVSFNKTIIQNLLILKCSIFLCIQNSLIIHFLAKYLFDLFLDNDIPIRRVVRITREELNSQTECELGFNYRFSKIDLTKPESPKIDISNLAYLSKLKNLNR